jgi:hypothetical protein
MSKRIALLGIAVVFALTVTTAAFAAKGGGTAGGNNTATIAFANTGSAAISALSTGSQASFAVTANVKPADVYSLWVANICSQNGVTVSAEYHPVQNWLAGPFTVTGAQCTAYVWLFPDAWTPLKGGSMTYAVTG